MADHTIIEVPVDEIFLDEENPRLPTSAGKSQAQMILYIARNTSITELMTAIAENGYFPGEPIIVVPRKSGGYWAVEGNRRLTALKLLRDPTLYPKNKRVAEISETATHRPETVPCVVFNHRDEVVNYLGYRHITGVKQWEPLAKARYIAQYIDTQTDTSLDAVERYRETARGIGSTYPFVKRQLDGLAIFRLMESEDFYGIESLTEETISFSLLSTAVGYEAILKFVSRSGDPYFNPEALNKDAIRNLAIWLFRPQDDGSTILGDSRNIQRLAVIAADNAALEALIDTRDFGKAFALTKGVDMEFNDLLVDINKKISEAVASVALVELNDGHKSKIDDIHKQARALRAISENVL